MALECSGSGIGARGVEVSASVGAEYWVAASLAFHDSRPRLKSPFSAVPVTFQGGRTLTIEAAGGLLWRETPAGPVVAVIHRSRHDDWTLPKGKAEPGESPEQTALREVLEETGCEARLGPFAGELRYDVKGKPKVVRFWHMEVARLGTLEPNDEVDRVEWLAPDDAVARLDYDEEARLVKTRQVRS